MKILLIWARSLVSGWAALLTVAYVVEGPVLYWTAPLIGASWIATVHLGFDCAALAAAGWVAGRTNRAHPMRSAILFAVTLSFWDFGTTIALNVPWLLRLARNSFEDSRFLDSLATGVETHLLLFGCLFAGASLSRAAEKPVSIVLLKV